jgi:uncharacterized membrane protein YqjE
VSDGTPGTAPSGGLRRALARAGASVLGLVRTRLQLASVEFAEERERVRSRLILAMVAAMFFAFGVLALSALVVLLFWDTHRVAALAAVTALHFAIGAGAWWRLKAQQRSAPQPFAATLSELERDREWLAAEMRDGTGG